jgi:hypothetical protein
MLYLRTESQGFVKSNSKTKKRGGGGQNSNHEVFIFLMVHCLLFQFKRIWNGHIEISTTI